MTFTMKMPLMVAPSQWMQTNAATSTSDADSRFTMGVIGQEKKNGSSRAVKKAKQPAASAMAVPGQKRSAPELSSEV